MTEIPDHPTKETPRETSSLDLGLEILVQFLSISGTKIRYLWQFCYIRVHRNGYCDTRIAATNKSVKTTIV
jgi:hypothetical protein